MPNLYILSGCNGAGKTTASYTILPELLGCSNFVNSDEFAKMLSPFDPSMASVGASRYMVMKIQYLLERNMDCVIETTLATRTLLKIVEVARSRGYKITLLYFWLNSPELAIKRVHARVEAGGHNIPDDVVRRRYVMGLQYFFDTYAPASDHWILADNTQSPFVVVAEGDKNETIIRDEEKYKRIRNICGRDQ